MDESPFHAATDGIVALDQLVPFVEYKTLFEYESPPAIITNLFDDADHVTLFHHSSAIATAVHETAPFVEYTSAAELRMAATATLPVEFIAT